MKRLKLLVVGLDGATWSVVEPLARAGRLPNLARIMQGVQGPLESTIPPVTPPAWTSLMTGKNPGKHGLFHFVEPEPGSYAMRYTNARSRKARTIWSILSEAGHRVGVVNVPMTFPPEPVEGFMISGMDTPDEGSDFVYPQRLAPGIRQAAGPIKLDARYLGFMHNDQRRQQVLRELGEIDEQRLRMIVHLLDREPVDVFMVVYGSPDTVQHYFWHYGDRSHYRHDPQGATIFGRAIQDVYERLDGHIGVLTERLGEDGVAMVVSDHGFGPTSSKTIYINHYLEELGVLTYRKNGHAGPGRLLGPVVRRLDPILRGSLSHEQKRRIARFLPKLRVRWEASLNGLEAIDWSATKAYCGEALALSSALWINVKGCRPDGIVDPGAEYQELTDFIVDRLQALKDPSTGRPMVRQVLRKAEVYQGPWLERAPDLLLAWWEDPGFNVKATHRQDRHGPAIQEAPSNGSGEVEWSGTHRLEGILAVSGRGIKHGDTIAGAQIMDLGPTILYLMGEPVPEDMDGRVLTDLFDATRLERYPVAYGTAVTSADGGKDATYSEEESEIIHRRLQDLGYVE